MSLRKRFFLDNVKVSKLRKFEKIKNVIQDENTPEIRTTKESNLANLGVLPKKNTHTSLGKCPANRYVFAANGFRYVTHRHKGDRRIESPWRGGVSPFGKTLREVKLSSYVSKVSRII